MGRDTLGVWMIGTSGHSLLTPPECPTTHPARYVMFMSLGKQFSEELGTDEWPEEGAVVIVTLEHGVPQWAKATWKYTDFQSDSPSDSEGHRLVWMFAWGMDIYKRPAQIGDVWRTVKF